MSPKLLVAALLLAGAAPAAAQNGDSAAIPPGDPSFPGLVAAAPPPPPPLRICAGGDVTLGTNLDTAWVHTARARLGRRVAALPSPDSLLAPIAPLLADADVVLLNVEGAIGEGRPARRKCAPGSTACFAFRSPPAAAGALRRVAPQASVIANLANNHARDAGDAGWRETARRLVEADVSVTGQDTLATLVATPFGDTVAVIGFSAWAGPGVHDLGAVARHVARAAARHRRVVVSVHLGAEGPRAVRTADRLEVAFGESRGNPVAFARAAVEAGADVVFGHGPHVMRAAEWRGESLVFYSLGNLVTYGPFSMGEPLNRGAIACADLDPDGRVVGAELRSTRQRMPGLVAVDSTAAAARLVDRLGREDFPESGARVAPDGRIPLPPGSALHGSGGGRREPATGGTVRRRPTGRTPR